MGGYSERALKRIARIADGYFPGATPLEGSWQHTIEKMRRWRQDAGRDPADLGIEARIQAGTGNPDDWRRQAADWQALGATHLSVNTMNGGLTGPEAHIQRITQAKDALRDL